MHANDTLKMLDFMDYVQQAFFSATHWNRDNSYGALTATARGTHQSPPSCIRTANLSSTPRLPHPNGPNPQPLLSPLPQLRNLILPRQRRHSRRLALLPLFLATPPRPLSKQHHLPPTHNPRVPATPSPAPPRRALPVGTLARRATHRPTRNPTLRTPLPARLASRSALPAAHIAHLTTENLRRIILPAPVRRQCPGSPQPRSRQILHRMAVQHRLRPARGPGTIQFRPRPALRRVPVRR